MMKCSVVVAMVFAVLVKEGLCRHVAGSLDGHRNTPTDKNASHTVPDKFITGGSPTGIGQYPWLAHLVVKFYEWTGSKMIHCGGSLISSRHVITAAHCLDFNIRSHADVNIYLAEYNTATFPRDCAGSQCVDNVLMHPDKITVHRGYNRRTYHNDIAMLRLRRAAPNTDHIRAIALPTFNINDQKYEGTPLIISGWGQTEHGEASTIKLHTQVQVVSPNTCRRHVPVTQGMLCAAGRNGQDSCFGDSGGPIMVEQGGNYQLVGIVSFGISNQCGTSKPAVYTNVFSYLDWIQDSLRN